VSLNRSLRAMAFSWPNLDFRGKNIIRSAEDAEPIPLVIQPNLAGVDFGKARRREARSNAGNWGWWATVSQCPPYPRKQTLDRSRGMSAKCQKQI